MAKFSLPKQEERVSRSSIRIPVSMLARIDADMKLSGFNRKQRSQWIEEVINELLARSDCAGLIAEEFILSGSTESIPISLSNELISNINKTLEVVSRDENILKDRSALIRTAITQRLLARAGMQLSPRETLSKKIAELGEAYDAADR